VESAEKWGGPATIANEVAMKASRAACRRVVRSSSRSDGAPSLLRRMAGVGRRTTHRKTHFRHRHSNRSELKKQAFPLGRSRRLTLGAQPSSQPTHVVHLHERRGWGLSGRYRPPLLQTPHCRWHRDREKSPSFGIETSRLSAAHIAFPTTFSGPDDPSWTGQEFPQVYPVGVGLVVR